MRVAVPLRRSYRLINHGPTTLISAAHGPERNVMAAAWVVALDFEPPKIAAVIAQGTKTRELVEASGEFVVNLPTADMLEAVYGVGTISGHQVDKFSRYGLATEAAEKVEAPLVRGCAAWLECRVLPEIDLQERYDLFPAEVVAAWADDDLFVDGEWRFPDDRRRTVHHVAGGAFFLTGERLSVAEKR